MSAETATFERVRAAAAELRQRGITPTASRVLEVTGGSKSTVLTHLRRIREGVGTEADTLPPAVLEMARSALVDVYESGRRAEIDRQRAVTERTALAFIEQEEQIVELAAENARLEASVADAEATAADQKSIASAARASMAELEAKLEKVETELSREKAEGSARLVDAMSKLDALLALSEMSTMMPGVKRRPTSSGQGGAS